MRTLLTVCAALVVVLGIVSGDLWRELQSSRQQLADLQGQLDQAKISIARLMQAPAPVPPRAIEAPAARPVAAQIPQPLPVPSAPAPPPAVVTASVREPLIGGSAEERHADALVQSDRTATARVQAWSTVLNLSPEQLQALNDTAKAELRRETEESLQIDSRTGPMDAQTAAQLKIETINRQHETNLRILDRMTPQLTPAQSNTMRNMFEAWVRAHLAAARVEQERAGISGN